MMTASDALMLPVMSTSMDQMKARCVEDVSTACPSSYITLYSHDPK